MENLHLLTTGRGTYYDRNINIMSWTDESKIIVGRYCSIARDCTFILNANHRPDWVTTSTMLRGPVTPELDKYLNTELGHNSSRGDIVIGNDVWIGTKAIISSGVHIGDGAVIAAGSLVTKNVAPYSVVGGNPAQLLYYRFAPEVNAKLLEIKWWDWPESRIQELSKFLWSNDIMAFIGRALYDIDNVKKVEIGRVDKNRIVYYWNVTTQPVKVVVKLVEHDGTVKYEEAIELFPDIEYFTVPYASEQDLRFIIFDSSQQNILDETEIIAQVQE